MEEWMDLKVLAAQGHSIRAITEMTGLSRNTVRRALRRKGPEGYRKPARKSKLHEFKSYIEKRYQECALSALRLVEEIRAQGVRDAAGFSRAGLQFQPGHARPYPQIPPPLGVWSLSYNLERGSPPRSRRLQPRGASVSAYNRARAVPDTAGFSRAEVQI